MPLQMIENPTKWWLHEVGPIERFVAEKIALVGDAVSFLGRCVFGDTHVFGGSCNVAPSRCGGRPSD